MKHGMILVIVLLFSSMVFPNEKNALTNKDESVWEIILQDGRAYVGTFVKFEKIEDDRIATLVDSTGQEFQINMKEIKYQKNLDDNFPSRIKKPAHSNSSMKSSKTQLSFQIGKSFLYTDANVSHGSSSNYYDYYEVLLFSPFAPGVISSTLHFNSNNGIAFRITTGYSFSSNTIEYDQPVQTFEDPDKYTVTIDEEYRRDTYSLSGFHIEGSMTYPIAVNKNSKFLIYPGIGLGYYHYGMSGNWEMKYQEEVYIGWDQFQTITINDKGDYEKSRLSGFAQTIIFGMEFRVKNSVSFVLEFAKLGLHTIKFTKDEDWTKGDFRKNIGKETSTQESFPGFMDVGITFGVKINLQKM